MPRTTRIAAAGLYLLLAGCAPLTPGPVGAPAPTAGTPTTATALATTETNEEVHMDLMDAGADINVQG